MLLCHPVLFCCCIAVDESNDEEEISFEMPLIQEFVIEYNLNTCLCHVRSIGLWLFVTHINLRILLNYIYYNNVLRI